MKNALKIEPLSEEKWAEIENGVFAALDQDAGSEVLAKTNLASVETKMPKNVFFANRARKQMVVASVSAALAAAAAIFWIGTRESQVGSREEVAALASVQPKEAVAIASARPVTQVATQASPSTVRIEGADLEVAPETGLTVEDDPVKGTSVFLSRGSATFEVAPRTNRPPFFVWAGTTRVRVVGTKFTVSRSERGSAVSVQSGVVEVVDANETKLLYKGDFWPPQALQPGEEPQGARPHGTGSPSANPRKHTRITNGNTHSHRDAKSHVVATSQVKGSPGATSTSEVGGVAGSPEERAKVDLAAREPQAIPTIATRFEQASALERKEPERALALYRALAREGSGSWNQNALFAAARLQADRGQKEGAIATLEEYLRKYPHGANAEDAKSLVKLLRP